MGADEILNLLDFGKWSVLIEILSKRTEPVIQDGVLEGFEQIGIEPPPDMLNLVNEKAVAFAQNRAAELVGKRLADGVIIDNPNPVWSIPESTRDMLRGVVTEAMEQGLSGKALANRIREEYAFSEARAETIARTECAFADANGNFLSYVESGVVTGKRSVLSNNENHGADDIANAAQGVIPLTQAFQSGHMTVPFHPRCQCDLVPEVA